MALHALPSPEPDEPPFDMLVKGKAVEVALGRGLATTAIEETIEGSPTVTVNVSDQPRALLSAGLLDHDDNGRLDSDLDLVMLGATWRLAGFAKSGDMFASKFEDAAVWILKRRTGKLRPKSGTDHVAFARRLVEGAGLVFVTVGSADLEPKKKAPAAKKAAPSSGAHGKGFANGAKITIRNWDGGSHTFTSGELQNAERVLNQCAKDKAPERATLAALCAGIVEAPFFQNSGVATDHTSTGVFQLLSSTAASHGISALDIEACTHHFLTRGFWKFPGAITLAKSNRSIGTIAADVEGCAAQFRGRYDQVLPGARELFAAFGGADATVDAGGTGGAIGSAPAVVVARGTAEDPGESSWKALLRMAAVKGYRVWAVRNTIHYCRERDLIDQRPALVLSEASDGVDWIDWEWLPGAKVNSAEVQCRVALAASVPPGSCVMLKDSGPADGRWIVATVSRGSRFAKSVTMQLRRGTELIKPQAATGTVAAAGGGISSDASGGGKDLGNGLSYPLPIHGSDLGGVAAHKSRPFGNWQSDNAVDIGCPQGTPVLAVDNGTIVKLGGHWDGTGQSNPNGFNVTLRTGSNAWFYTHLRSRKPLHVGQVVTRGQELGRSGAAAGVAHLHIGCEHGDPEKLLKVG